MILVSCYPVIRLKSLSVGSGEVAEHKDNASLLLTFSHGENGLEMGGFLVLREKALVNSIAWESGSLKSVEVECSGKVIEKERWVVDQLRRPSRRAHRVASCWRGMFLPRDATPEQRDSSVSSQVPIG